MSAIKIVWKKSVAPLPFGVSTGIDTATVASTAILPWQSCIRSKKKGLAGNMFWTGVFAERIVCRRIEGNDGEIIGMQGREGGSVSRK